MLQKYPLSLLTGEQALDTTIIDLGGQALDTTIINLGEQALDTTIINLTTAASLTKDHPEDRPPLFSDNIFTTLPFLVQFSSVQSLDQLGLQGNMRDDSAEIQSVLEEPLASSSDMAIIAKSNLLTKTILCLKQFSVECREGLSPDVPVSQNYQSKVHL